MKQKKLLEAIKSRRYQMKKVEIVDLSINEIMGRIDTTNEYVSSEEWVASDREMLNVLYAESVSRHKKIASLTKKIEKLEKELA